MKPTRLLIACGLLWLLTGSVARADDPTPGAEPTSPPAVVFQQPTPSSPVSQPPVSQPPISQPTAPPPVVATAPPVAADTPVPDTSYVPVAKEPAVAAVTSVPPASAESTAPPAATEPQVYATPVPATSSWPQTVAQHHGSTTSTSTSTVPATNAPAVPASVSSVPPVPPDQSSASQPPVIDVNAGPTGYAAPSELSCTSKSKPVSGPFLVSPYSGWSEINSFLDHDNPDYRVDGTIVLANGLVAAASDGISSDFFPAYWSSSLRQYINYDGHNGYDFGISYQPVLAAAAGTVSYAGWNGSSENQGYGLMVLIDHHNGYVTLYGHLSQLAVKTGDKVSAGQEIGISGSTGNSTGPHLHFSVFHNCLVTDPYGWTSSGRDPLLDFDGEHASYLWLPGHDPLVLNPPPSWPTYPLGLKVPASVVASLARSVSVVRRVPPAQRLLLLALPAPRSGEPVSATVALARTESQLTQEAEALTPYLADLQAQGLIDNYQLIPAAGAVWVSGTATATQLEGLPGVASLAGVQPRDLVAAQAGLAHSILIQVGPQQAPSLWPVGFRSALHAWRPIAAVSNGHALVTGFTLPGERVLVSLQRRGTLIGAAGALADPENGGFVVMIHDKAGNPVTTRPGDIVQVSSSGRAAQVRVMTLAVKAREHRVTGTAQPGSTVLLALISTSGEAVQRQVATADASGSFAMRVRGMLPAGTLAVASGVDFAGDQESATAFVPGVHVVEGGTTVQGWTVGDAPYLEIRRDGKLLLQRNLHPAPDGSFQIDLQRGGRPLVLDAGDVLSLGSRWHRRYFTVPSLRVALGFGANHIRIFGAARARVHVAIERVGSEDRGREVRLDAHGVGLVTWPGGPAEVGDGASAEIVASGGNTVEATADVGGIVLHEGEARVTGRVRPGSTLSIHLSTGSGKMLAGAVASGSATTGNFAATLKDMRGRTVSIRSGLRLDVRDGSRTETTAVLPIDLAISRGDYAILGETAPARAVWLTIVDRQGHQQIRRLETSSTGRISVHLSQSTLLSPPAGVSLSTALVDGITIERSIAGKETNHRSVRQSATNRPALPRSKQHARHSPG